MKPTIENPNSPLMTPMLFSVQQACDVTGVGKTKLYELINAGEIKARKIGKRTVILQDDLKAYLHNLDHYQPRTQ